MTSNITKTAPSPGEAQTAPQFFDDWFDPIETAVRERAREFIEELIRSELDAALARPRYVRSKKIGGEGTPTVTGHRHGSRTRSLTGSFGPIEIAVPRARLNTADGKTREWKSQALRAYQRRTLGADALIDSCYLAGTNTRRVRPQIVRSTLSSGLLFRDRKMIGDGDDNVSLVVSVGRALSVSHRKREARLARNEAIMTQADAPGSAGTKQQFAVFEVSIAQREWESRDARPGDALMNVINCNSKTLALFLGYIRALAKAGLPSVAEARQLVRRHLIDLIIFAATEPSLVWSPRVAQPCLISSRRISAIQISAVLALLKS